MKLSYTDHYHITFLRDCPELLDSAAAWFSGKWGIPVEAYQESMKACIQASSENKTACHTASFPKNPEAEPALAVHRQTAVPQWYIIQNEHQEIIAGCGIIDNDFHERTDLTPNLCALYVEEAYRKRGIAGQLLNLVCHDMAQMGILTLYLITDHTSFYERYGWEFDTMVKENDGQLTRLYKHTCTSSGKVLVFGSLNLDHVYQVEHIVTPGETIASHRLQTFCGGKGLNQAIAFSRAGADTWLAGKIGADGEPLKRACEQYQVRTDYLLSCTKPSGHAIIQVDCQGQNSILLFGGANQEQTRPEIDQILQNFGKGDRLVLQNEINELPYLIEAAAARKMEIILNPSPYHPDLMQCGLKHLSWLILNEIEAFQITGKTEPSEIFAELGRLCPNASFVLTLGKEGSLCQWKGQLYKQTCYPAETVDTTAAGDTFTGYFFTELLLRESSSFYKPLSCDPIKAALRIASQAAALTVSRQGAADSIPRREELNT